MAWTLIGAIAAEIIGTLALKASDGFTKWWPIGVTAVGYALAFWLLALTLTTMEVGRAYAIWAGLGTAGATIGGVLLFGDRLSITAIIGIGVIIGGVVMVNVGAQGA